MKAHRQRIHGKLPTEWKETRLEWGGVLGVPVKNEPCRCLNPGGTGQAQEQSLSPGANGCEWELGNAPALVGSWDRGVVVPNPGKATGSILGPAELGQSRTMGGGGCLPQQLDTCGSTGSDGSEQAELSGSSWLPCSSLIPQAPQPKGHMAFHGIIKVGKALG